MISTGSSKTTESNLLALKKKKKTQLIPWTVFSFCLSFYNPTNLEIEVLAALTEATELLHRGRMCRIVWQAGGSRDDSGTVVVIQVLQRVPRFHQLCFSKIREKWVQREEAAEPDVARCQVNVQFKIYEQILTYREIINNGSIYLI